MKPWTKKADRHFKSVRLAMCNVHYYLRELRDELRYRESDKDSQNLMQSMVDALNKLARDKIWPFYEKHNPEGYAKAFPNGPDWRVSKPANLDNEFNTQVERREKMEKALNKCWKISESYKEDGRAVSELKQVFRDLQKDYDAITKQSKLDSIQGYCHYCDKGMKEKDQEFLADEFVCCSQECVDDWWAQH